MIDIRIKKTELEFAIRNSIWDNSSLGISYTFQNENELWINENVKFDYQLEIEGEKVVLKYFPNGKGFFIELISATIIHLQDDKQQFELKFNRKLVQPT